MARSQTNLTIGIGVDTSKFIADAAIVKNELRNITREVQAAAKAGDVPRLQAASQQQATLTKQYAALTREIRGNSAALTTNAAAAGNTTSQFKNLGDSLRSANASIALVRGGIVALVAGLATNALVGFIRSLNELRAAAADLGTSPAMLQGLRNAFVAAGRDAKEADAFLQRAEARVKRLADLQRDQRLAQDDAARAFTEKLAEPGATHAEASAARAAAQRELEKTDPLTKLESLRGREREDFADKLGLTLDRAEQIAAGIAATAKPAIVPSAEDMAALDAYNKKVAEGLDLWRRVGQAIAIGTARLFTGDPQGLKPSEVSGGMAAGGFIRGAGTGRSDSILARLSNGEFVINAASVQRLGVGFLQSLNSYATGGLIGMPPIRFAEGGLASAAAGASAATFVFENGSAFKLSGPADVVNSMVKAAHSQQMKSAGVKPSWFAGRPGGR